MEVQINWVGVALAAASTMVVGSVWYARSVFGSTWMKLAKVKENQMKDGAVQAMVLAFLASLVTAYILAHFAYLSNTFFNNSWMADSVITAFWGWLGFTAARMLTHDLFEGRPNQLTVLNLANELVTFLAMGIVIGLFQP